MLQLLCLVLLLQAYLAVWTSAQTTVAQMMRPEVNATGGYITIYNDGSALAQRLLNLQPEWSTNPQRKKFILRAGPNVDPAQAWQDIPIVGIDKPLTLAMSNYRTTAMTRRDENTVVATGPPDPSPPVSERRSMAIEGAKVMGNTFDNCAMDKAVFETAPDQLSGPDNLFSHTDLWLESKGRRFPDDLNRTKILLDDDTDYCADAAQAATFAWLANYLKNSPKRLGRRLEIVDGQFVSPEFRTMFEGMCNLYFRERPGYVAETSELLDFRASASKTMVDLYENLEVNNAQMHQLSYEYDGDKWSMSPRDTRMIQNIERQRRNYLNTASSEIETLAKNTVAGLDAEGKAAMEALMKKEGTNYLNDIDKSIRTSVTNARNPYMWDQQRRRVAESKLRQADLDYQDGLARRAADLSTQNTAERDATALKDAATGFEDAQNHAAEIERLRSSLDTALKAKEVDIVNQATEVSRLSSLHAAGQTEVTRLRTQNDRLGEMTRKNEKLQNDLDEMKRKHGRMLTVQTDLERGLREASATVDQTSQELSNVRKQLAVKNAAITAGDNSIGTLKEDLQEADARLESHAKETSRLRGEIMDHQHRLTKAEKQGHKEEQHRLRTQLDLSKEEARTLQLKDDSARAAKLKVTESLHQEHDLTHAAEVARSRLLREQAKKEQQLRQVHSHDVKDLQDKVHTLEADNAQLADDIEQKDEELRESKAQSQVDSSGDQATREAHLAQKERDFQVRSADLAEKEQQLAKDRADLDDPAKALAEADVKIAQAQTLRQEAEQKLTDASRVAENSRTLASDSSERSVAQTMRSLSHELQNTDDALAAMDPGEYAAERAALAAHSANLKAELQQNGDALRAYEAGKAQSTDVEAIESIAKIKAAFQAKVQQGQVLDQAMTQIKDELLTQSKDLASAFAASQAKDERIASLEQEAANAATKSPQDVAESAKELETLTNDLEAGKAEVAAQTQKLELTKSKWAKVMDAVKTRSPLVQQQTAALGNALTEAEAVPAQRAARIAEVARMRAAFDQTMTSGALSKSSKALESTPEAAEILGDAMKAIRDYALAGGWKLTSSMYANAARYVRNIETAGKVVQYLGRTVAAGDVGKWGFLLLLKYGS